MTLFYKRNMKKKENRNQISGIKKWYKGESVTLKIKDGRL